MKQDIENRFQILITISLFFPVLFYNLGLAAGQSEGKALSFSLLLGVLAGMIILDYILFQARKQNLTDRSLKRIGEWLLLGIGVFVVPILGVALSADPNLPLWLQVFVTYTWTIGTFLVLAFPIMVEMILLFVAKEKASTDQNR